MVPAFFMAHGAPTIVLENNLYIESLQQVASAITKPKAIIIFSAHWESPVQAISGVKQYDMIYDFGGFQKELYEIVYPAKGDASIAKEIQAVFEKEGIQSRIDAARGIDHGAWAVLYHSFPNPDVPVIAMSVNPYLSPREQYNIGKALGKLREKDYLIIGSGGLVHNLRKLNWMGGEAEAWALAFDNWIKEKVEAWDLEALFQYETLAPYAREAVPTKEHFIPLFIAMGAADNTRKPELVSRIFQYGSLSLSLWRFD
ncbi:MAG: class III extradiol ring-cleavage dioxygenase [Ectobacillus sp.]